MLQRCLPLAAMGVLAASLLAPASRAQAPADTTLRPPSVPLVAHDPYFSIWSNTNTLTGSQTRHWTGAEQTLSALVRVDGEAFRLMGSLPAGVPVMEQKSVKVLPTRTVYEFASDKIALTLTFTTPALPTDLPVLSRPITYLTFSVKSLDNKTHPVQIYTDAGSELAVNIPSQPVVWNDVPIKGMTALRIGSKNQPVLGKRGDNLRIDWGYLYLAAPNSAGIKSSIAPRVKTQGEWVKNGTLPKTDTNQPQEPAAAHVVAALALDMGKVSQKPVAKFVMVGYDDEYSLTYMGHPLRPYWRKNGMDMSRLLPIASNDYSVLQKRCADFDTELMADLEKVGGDKYAQIAALAYRQSLAANKVVSDENGSPLMFSKENFSNGCVATVDILYPAAPQLLLLSPTLTKASLVAILNYAASPRWKFPFAPHDLGTYPRADGQVYGGGERTEDNQMPIEETGNLMILLGAVAKQDGNAKFSEPFWPQIKAWAGYLESKGFDPESQLSTDDFAGHLAHNVNLSAKAIEALGAYAILCDLRGDKEEASRVRGVAQSMATKWQDEAKDGDHFRLAFDKPDTWSQKYNLVWDRILGINLFPNSVFQTETAYYTKNFNQYGLPLDSRKDYTKLDWTIWSATLSGSRTDFQSFVAPVYDFLNTTNDRNPMSDWYQTKEPRQVGFQARAVVGGVFLPLLADPAIWKKWASRDSMNTAKTPLVWSPLPVAPVVTSIVPTSEKEGLTWSYTFAKPQDGWSDKSFDDAAWKTGPGGFGRAGTSGAEVRTVWNTDDIWMRRTFTMPEGDIKNIQLYLTHDEDAEIYINGVLAQSVSGYNTSFEPYKISDAARATLKPGEKAVIAVHCHQTTGGQGVDVGLVRTTSFLPK